MLSWNVAHGDEVMKLLRDDSREEIGDRLSSTATAGDGVSFRTCIRTIHPTELADLPREKLTQDALQTYPLRETPVPRPTDHTEGTAAEPAR